MAEFDLTLLPLYRVKGQEWPQLPGLLAVSPPKNSARGRETDTLIIYLAISGNVPFSSTEYSQMVAQMAQRFYRSSGALTSAMRAAAEMVNQMLNDRNMSSTGKGQYLIGRLILGVLRGSQLVTAQCGPTHIFHLTNGECHQIHDAQMSGRGLGVGQSTPLYFSRLELRANDVLVLCIDVPSGWEAALLGERRFSVETLRRKLLSITEEDINAVMLHSQAGKGVLTVLQGGRAAREAGPPSPEQPSAPAPDKAEEAPPARPISRVESERPASRFAKILSEEQRRAAGGGEARAAPVPQRIPQAGRAAPPPALPRPVKREAPRFVTPLAPERDLPEIERPKRQTSKSFFRLLAKVIAGARRGAQKMADGLRSFLPKLLPQPEMEAEKGSSPLLFLAVAIPLLIAIVGGTVYTTYGKRARYQEYYTKAVEQAALARGQSDPTAVRLAWDSATYYLDLAEQYQQTDASRQLRQEAQTALDNLDGIVRLDFRAAIIGGLSRNLQVTRLVATATDLYLLDASRGNVLRAFMTAQGYELDPNFSCGPGQYGTTIVGPLIDIETPPTSNRYEARLLAIDKNGNLLYCGLGDPVAVPLAQPQFGWQGIVAFTLDSDGRTLYVLDPKGNAVWQYVGHLGEYIDLPTMFFGEQVPRDMNNAIDLAANNADLYLLFEDGHVTACPQIRYQGVPMRCSDPVTFVDTRPEGRPGPRLSDAVFTQMAFAAAPDPSLYLLEPLTRAVYCFSPRPDSLELRGQFQASVEMNASLFSHPATAMAIGPNRYLFFSAGNQVYFATDVP